jgi:predicted DNA-binding protein with PD1-like motif
MNRIRSFCSSLLATFALGVAGLAVAQAPAPAASGPLPDGYMRAPAVQKGLAPQMKVNETTGTAHVFDVAFTTGDEILSGLTDLAIKHNITSGYVTGLGGLSTALLGFGDPPINAFRRIPVDEKSELVSLTGHIQTRDGVPVVHLHAIVALKDGSTKAGHVFEAKVAPIAEISVVATSIGGAASH